MSTAPTREEIDAKLETMFSRWEAATAKTDAERAERQARWEADRAERWNKFESERAERQAQRDAAMDARVSRIEAKMDDFVEANKVTQDKISNLKSTMVVTAVSSVIAIVLGVAAFNATLLSNMVASFESGKNTATTQAQVLQQVKDTQALLDQIKKEHPTK
jgi:cell division protein FtsB